MVSCVLFDRRDRRNGQVIRRVIVGTACLLFQQNDLNEDDCVEFKIF